jgi:hypothetical protein
MSVNIPWSIWQIFLQNIPMILPMGIFWNRDIILWKNMG